MKNMSQLIKIQQFFFKKDKLLKSILSFNQNVSLNLESISKLTYNYSPFYFLLRVSL